MESAATQWCWRLGIAMLLLVPQAPACAWRPDPAAGAIIVAGLIVGGVAIMGPPPAEASRDTIAASVGSFNVWQHSGSTALYGAEYRFGGRRYLNGQPIIGVAATADDAKYGYAGLRFGLPVGDRLELSSDFALAGYSRGNGKDLGSAKEFYFEFGVDYRFANDTRIGLAVRHLSHDDLFSTYDPGADIVAVTISFPIR